MKLQKFQIAVILYLLAFPLLPLKSQHLMNVMVNIDIDDSVSAVVKITYMVNKGDLKTIPVKGLAFHGSKIYNVEAVFSNIIQNVAINEKNFLLTGSLSLPDNLAVDSVITIRFSYDVIIDSNKIKHGYIIPILFVDLKPKDAPADFFQATISMSSEQIISEAFPTVPMKFISETKVNRYKFSMQVLPSMVKLRLVNYGNNEFTLLGILDISVATLILILLGLGWMKLKQSLR